MRQWFLFICFLGLILQCKAQNFGGFAPSTKWKQINSDTARIIYAPAAKTTAQRVAQLVHAMAVDTPMTIGRGLKKINIVLHNQTTLANGYVGLGPFRSEYYLIPGADIFAFGTLPWQENLAVHEYRHVQQYNNFNNGLTKVFSILGGQNGRALANALAIPDWFFEGDAVFAETAFTGLGRGRQPLFLSGFNSLWDEGKHYSWMKLRNGSFKDYVPNQYPLGYLLVNYGYKKYGPDFWKKATKEASGFKGLFYPFQRAVQKYSNGDFKKFRMDALQYYSDSIQPKAVFVKDNVVTNYHFSQAIGADSLLYVKESYKMLPAFYLKDKSGEHKIKLRNITTENWFSYAKGVIAYTEYATDKRWNLTDYSNIILLNLATKKEKTLTHLGKYFTPDLAPDGEYLIAVYITDSLQTELHLLRVNDGAVLKKIRARNNDYFVHPKFIDAHHIIIGVRDADGTLSLQKLNVINGRTDILIPPQKSAIGDPFIQKDNLFFTASFSGNDEIYVYQLDEKKLFQLTTSNTGNYFATVLKDTLIWSRFTTMGLQQQHVSLSDLAWKERAIPQISNKSFNYNVAATTKNILQSAPRIFESKKYGKTTGLFNIHSWDPGLNVYSNNILNTMAGTAYYRYNESERSHTTGFGISYGGFFPVLTTSFENTFSRH
ncbi:MAG TPA: hypothetical protein VM010_06655, partial [Chitinophagaceae bacterium]|nr:hypothetical protein [Chitinophagaceae bacterium]